VILDGKRPVRALAEEVGERVCRYFTITVPFMKSWITQM
jgi:hypothetical protein